MPVFEQTAIEGHAVRAVLLFSGMAACAYENERSDYIEVVKRIWDNMAFRRMHVTGGIGAIKEDEKFGDDYYLPHDAYLETCAAVGAIFFSHSMYLLTGEAKYMDTLETILYNGALAGVSQNGVNYSYVNPLQSDGSIHRWNWHECPCCPPMDLKLYGQLPQMIYSHTADSVSVNLYIAGQAALPLQDGEIILRQSGSYLKDGRQKLIIEKAGFPFTLRLRVPSWCKSWSLTVNGGSAPSDTSDGYMVLQRSFQKGDVVEICFDMPVLLETAHPQVKECQNQVALRRGPFVYCLEETDNPAGLDFSLSGRSSLRSRYDRDLFGGTAVIEGTDDNGKSLLAIPFYLWDNRASGKMRVWIEGDTASAKDADWENRLYSYFSLENTE